MINHYI